MRNWDTRILVRMGAALMGVLWMVVGVYMVQGSRGWVAPAPRIIASVVGGLLILFGYVATILAILLPRREW